MENKFNVGDRVIINGHDSGSETGIVNYIYHNGSYLIEMDTPAGAYQLYYDNEMTLDTESGLTDFDNTIIDWLSDDKRD